MRRGMVLLLLLLAPCINVAAASDAPVVMVRDGVVVGLEGTAGSVWTSSVEMEAGGAVFLDVACGSCIVRMDADGTEVVSATGGATSVHTVGNAGTLTLHIEFVEEESAEVSFLTSTVAASSQRPLPTDDASVVLTQTGEGEDWWGGQLDRPRGDLEAAERVVFNPTSENDAYLLVEVAAPGWLDLVQRAGDDRAAVDIKLHEDGSESSVALSWSESDDLRWTRVAVGLGQRVLVQASTDYPDAVAVLDLVAHPAVGNLRMLNDTGDGFLLIGHGGQRAILEVDATHRLTLTPLTSSNLRVEHLVDGAWLESTLSNISEPTVFWPLPDAVALRLTCASQSCAVLGAIDRFGDLDSEHDAPNALDLSSDDVLTGSRTGLLPLNGTGTGHLVRAVHDVADVLTIHIDAWEDSVHLISVSVHAPGGAIVVDLVPLDPTTGAVDEHARRTTTMFDEDSISTQVGRGTHLLRLSVPDANETLATPWGSDLAALNYSVTLTHVVVDEGEEPWFPPNDTAEIWGERVRWILGASLLIPALGFAVLHRRRLALSKAIAAQRAMLSRITARLDAGRAPRLEQRDLRRALDAVALLDFDEACSGWGTPEVTYRTNEVALACWRLDPRLAEQDGERLLIGISNAGAQWDVVALRLDAPVGQPVNIVAVEPRFHFRGEEVFIDTLGAGTVTFLTIEVERGPTHVDVELNGLVESSPRAARATESLMLSIREEE